MRKLLCVLLTAALLLAALPFSALAADPKLDSIALLARLNTARTETTVVGAAVLVNDGSANHWLTASAWLSAGGGTFFLLMENGDLTQVTAFEPLGESGLAELTLTQDISATPAPLSAAGMTWESQSFLGYQENAALVSGGAEKAIACTLDDGSAGWIYNGPAGLLPGGATYDGDGAVTSIVLSALDEGRDRYLAISASAVRGLLTGGAQTPAAGPADANALTFERDNGYLYVSWEGLGLPADAEITVYYFDADNSFFTWVTHAAGSESDAFLLPAVPGRTLGVLYAVGSGPHGGDEFDRLADTQEPAVFNFDPATEMGHEYWQECYVSVLPAGTDPGSTVRLSPALNLTPDLLLSEENDVFLQVNSTYRITADEEDSLLICLYTPDGNCLTYITGFIWGMGYMAQDDWHVQVDELFEDFAELRDGALPAGTYTLTYYVGQAEGGTFVFTLEDAPEGSGV